MTVEIFWLCSCLLRSGGIRLGIAEWGKTTLNSVFPLSFHMDGWMDGPPSNREEDCTPLSGALLSSLLRVCRGISRADGPMEKHWQQETL